MTAKQKANSIYNEFCSSIMFDTKTDNKLEAKLCAQICIRRIYLMPLKVGAYLEEDEDKELYYSYWEDVLQELSKL